MMRCWICREPGAEEIDGLCAACRKVEESRKKMRQNDIYSGPSKRLESRLKLKWIVDIRQHRAGKWKKSL